LSIFNGAGNKNVSKGRGFQPRRKESSKTGALAPREQLIFGEPTPDLFLQFSGHPARKPANLDRHIIQRHLQPRNGRADFRMHTNLLLQRLQNLLSAFDMRLCLRRT
jgi:hypothetical protein